MGNLENKFTEDRKRNLRLAAGTAFLPASPIDSQSLFAGRQKQLERILESVNMRGRHILLYGERGVGKTSLTTVLKDVLSQFYNPLQFIRVNCDASDSFESIWRKIFKDLHYSFLYKPPGFESSSEEVRTSVIDYLQSEISVDDVRSHLAHLSGFGKYIIVLDEFDRITDLDTKTKIADTIKTLSDNAVNATIIIVGVADSVSDLIAHHYSIERALEQIQMPRMDHLELSELLSKSLSKLSEETSMDFKMRDDARSRVVLISQGLPHYTHLLGLASTKQAILRGSNEVTLRDVIAGTEDAVAGAQKSTEDAYHKATDSNRKDTLFRPVLLACAMTPADQRGYFSAGDVRSPLAKILGRNIPIPNFAKHLGEFSGESRGRALTMSGSKRNIRYRFTNPLLQPYTIIRSIRDKLVSDETLDTLMEH